MGGRANRPMEHASRSSLFRREVKIRDFRWAVDVLLPAVLLAVTIWGLTAGDWQLALPAAAFLLFQVVWTLRRVEITDQRLGGKFPGLLSRIPYRWMLFASWMLSLTVLAAVLAALGVAPALIAIVSVGSLIAGLAVVAIARLFADSTEK